MFEQIYVLGEGGLLDTSSAIVKVDELLGARLFAIRPSLLTPCYVSNRYRCRNFY